MYSTSEVRQHELKAFRRRYRKAVMKLARRLNGDYFITLNFNTEVTPDGAARQLARFLAIVDRKLLGPKWSEKLIGRADFIFFPEHQETNFHFHGIGTFPFGFSALHRGAINSAATTAWRKVVPSGTIDIQRMPTRSDIRVVSRYVTKELYDPNRDGTFILSRQFWRH